MSCSPMWHTLLLSPLRSQYITGGRGEQLYWCLRMHLDAPGTLSGVVCSDFAKQIDLAPASEYTRRLLAREPIGERQAR
jgi:hypothetical protein